jgi:hypothetical protein
MVEFAGSRCVEKEVLVDEGAVVTHGLIQERC